MRNPFKSIQELVGKSDDEYDIIELEDAGYDAGFKPYYK